jgi:hypothetical protein
VKIQEEYAEADLISFLYTGLIRGGGGIAMILSEVVISRQEVAFEFVGSTETRKECHATRSRQHRSG